MKMCFVLFFYWVLLSSCFWLNFALGVKLSFKTWSPDGLLLSAFSPGHQEEFLAIQIKNGRPYFLFDPQVPYLTFFIIIISIIKRHKQMNLNMYRNSEAQLVALLPWNKKAMASNRSVGSFAYSPCECAGSFWVLLLTAYWSLYISVRCVSVVQFYWDINLILYAGNKRLNNSK